MFDVVAINMKTKTVRFIKQGLSERDADAAVRMSVMRLGVEEEIFATVSAGSYKEGDTWVGRKNNADGRNSP